MCPKGPIYGPRDKVAVELVKLSGLLFSTFWDINLKLVTYIQQVAQYVDFEFHHNCDTFTFFTARNKLN